MMFASVCFMTIGMSLTTPIDGSVTGTKMFDVREQRVIDERRGVREVCDLRKEHYAGESGEVGRLTHPRPLSVQQSGQLFVHMFPESRLAQSARYEGRISVRHGAGAGGGRRQRAC